MPLRNEDYHLWCKSVGYSSIDTTLASIPPVPANEVSEDDDDDDEIVVPVKPPVKGETPLKCPHCDKMYTYKTAFNTHLQFYKDNNFMYH